MSKRNGDKARFQKQRKRKILLRTRIRELRKALEHNKAAQDTSMISAQRLLIAILGVVLSAPVFSAPDLSTYRDFHIGMNLEFSPDWLSDGRRLLFGNSSGTKLPLVDARTKRWREVLSTAAEYIGGARLSRDNRRDQIDVYLITFK